MIRSLRRRHRAIWTVLAILLPVLFVIGLSVRHSRPTNPDAAIQRAVGGVQR